MFAFDIKDVIIDMNSCKLLYIKKVKIMNVILYKSKHGATRKIGKVLNQYIGDCLLMNLTDVDYATLQKADIIIVGTPVYYGKLDLDIVRFVKENQNLLVPRKYCLYVVGIFQNEFMAYVTAAFDYDILKNIRVIDGLGGALYYPQLSVIEKLVLQVMNKRSPVINKEKGKDIFENFNNEEIALFAKKIKKLKNNGR